MLCLPIEKLFSHVVFSVVNLYLALKWINTKFKNIVEWSYFRGNNLKSLSNSKKKQILKLITKKLKEEEKKDERSSIFLFILFQPGFALYKSIISSSEPLNISSSVYSNRSAAPEYGTSASVTEGFQMRWFGLRIETLQTRRNSQKLQYQPSPPDQNGGSVWETNATRQSLK